MSLNSEQRNDLRAFLQSSPEFFLNVPLLRYRPFRFPDCPGKRGTLHEAAATKPRKELLQALFSVGSFLVFSGAVMEYFIWPRYVEQKAKQPLPGPTRDDVERFVIRLLSFNPENLPSKLFHSMPILCIALGILLLFAGGVFVLLEVPAHQADPLLARLLQEKLGSKSAPPNSYIQSLLANLRFKAVFVRASRTVFPLKSSIQDAARLIGGYGETERASIPLPPDWDDFCTRLLSTLDDHEPFVHFMENHPAISADVLYDNGLREHLDYGMRQLLFSEILSDPDCAFLYRNTSDLWHGIFQWISTADLKKIYDLFPKTEKSSGGVDTKSLAVYLLIAVLLIGLLPRISGQNSSKDDGKTPQAPPVIVDVKLDTRELVAKLTELAAKLCQQCAQQPQQTQPPHISISIPPPPVPAANVPPIQVPSKIEVTLTSTVPPAKTEIQQNINTVPATSQSGESGSDHTQAPKPPMQGDTLVSFTRSKPSAQPQQQGQLQNAADAGLDLVSAFVLNTPFGNACHYNATLKQSARTDKWPPDPVQIFVQSAGPLPVATDCPPIPSMGATISVSRKPLFNDVLKAYVSLNEKHSRHRLLGGHNQIVVLIHYPSPT